MKNIDRKGSYIGTVLLGSVLIITSFMALNCAKSKLEPNSTSEFWHLMTIANQPVGYMHTLQSPEESGGVTTSIEFQLVINREGAQIKLEYTASQTESSDGLLVRSENRSIMSTQSTKMEATVGEDKITVVREVGGKSFANDIPYSGQVLGTSWANRLSASRLKNEGDQIEYQIFQDESGLLTKVSRTLIDKETMEVLGKSVDTLKIAEHFIDLNLKSTIWLDTKGRLVRMLTPGPFGQTETILTDQQTALAAVAGGEIPAEMYGQSIARTNIRLPQARQMERLVLKFRHRNPDLGWPDMSDDFQTVLAQSPDEMVLEVRRQNQIPEVTLPVKLTDENREYLEANAYIQSNDPEVIKTAAEIIGEEKDAMTAALLLEDWTAENMNFDMGVVLAPSSEVFKNRRGTCSEYAILLTTLTRAAGIPSRFVMGSVYTAGMFGGHAWVEVLLGDTWVPLDGAIVTQGPADAARFKFLADSLEQGPGFLNAGPAVQIYGQVDIDIVEFQVHGRDKVVVSPEDPPYRVEGNAYVNPWLGLEVIKPEGFRFTDLDSVWPARTVVGMEGTQGENVSISQYWGSAREKVREFLEKREANAELEEIDFQGYQAFRIGDRDSATTIILNGVDLWTVDVVGKEAGSIMEKILANLDIDSLG